MSGGGSRLTAWWGELRRRKVIRVAAVYLFASWLLIQVADATFEPMGLPGWALKMVIVLAVLGFPLACALAWAFDVTPRGIERTAPAERREVEVPAAERPAALPSPAPQALPPAESVAILPFTDMSPEADQEYFCDGIAEEIINALCCVRGLRIASRTSSFQFKGRPLDVREIGRTLGVRAVLEGSVRKAGERVRITAQLVSTADGYHLWSESYDRRLEDVFAIQTDIAQRLVRALQVALGPGESRLIERGGTRNAEAYDFYLRGQQLLRDYGDGTARQAAELFHRAIEHDRSFAQAYAGLANALAVKGLWRLDMTQQEFDEAVTASEHALRLEPWMPEAHLARANLMSMMGRSDAAARDFEEAIRLNPTWYYSHYLYARHCFSQGQFAKAEELARTAARLDPEDYQPLAVLSDALRKLGRSQEADQADAQVAVATDRRIREDPGDVRALLLAAIQAARSGDGERARELSKRAVAARPDDFSTAYNTACVHALLGDRPAAIELLDRAVKHGRGNLGWMENDPDLESLRGEPGFEAVLGRVRAATAGAAG